MKDSETGKFELAVGRRELLSAFFVVIVLVAVGFAMGYVVGQNTGSGKDGATRPAIPANRPQQAASAPLMPAGQVSPSPNPGAPATPAVVEPSEAKPPSPPPQQAAPPPPSRAAAPVPGSYWQVKALRKDGAEVLVQTLKDMGLPAVMSPSPAKPALMRVLVGPYSDTETMGRVKSQLEKAGLRPIRNNLK